MTTDLARLATDALADDRVATKGPWETIADLTRQLAEANRELERWRHGAQIEGDYVCPDSLALIEARAELRAVGAKP